MSDFPTTYDNTTTSRYTAPERPPIGPVFPYVKSVPGILRISEMVICLIAFICASVYMPWAAFGGGWAQFVTMSAFVVVLIVFLITFLNIKPRIPIPWPFAEFVFYAVYTLFLLIAGIVSAVRSHYHSSIVATMVFVFVATGLFVADTFLMYRSWITARYENKDTSATTITTTTYMSREEY